MIKLTLKHDDSETLRRILHDAGNRYSEAASICRDAGLPEDAASLKKDAAFCRNLFKRIDRRMA